MFESSKLKIKRANHHIDELQSAIANFCKTNFCILRTEIDPNDGTYSLIFHQTKDIPSEIPLIIGDAAHNLRTALDLLACDVVTLGGDVPDRHTKFPFRGESRDDLIAAINGGKLKTASAGIIEIIVDTIQPYIGGKNAVLFRLHDLDIQDKHLLITPVISVIGLHGVDCEWGDNNKIINTSMSVSSDRKLRAIMASAPIKITKQGQPTFDVRFDKGQPFEGQSVVPTLHKLSQLVSGVVDTIEQAFLALAKHDPRISE